MKIVDAVWEKRNLGVETCEIIVENKSDIEGFWETLPQIDSEYLVVKFPTGLVEFADRLTDNGFRFIEATVACHYDIRKEYNLNSVQKRFFDNCDYDIMNNDDLEELHTNLCDTLFETDRIALDPHFTIQQANNRYWNWINDEIERGAEIYKILYKQKSVGFFGLKGPKNKPYEFLAGIYKPFQNVIGSIMNYMAVEAAKEHGAIELHGVFSTNNRGAFANHMLMGYVLDSVENVFVKHNIKNR
ncbi:MAG: hypothetical protein HDT48_01260 [Ruminococcaceae bacterium]|nr:hypothetical protein [Oscillospiraceae bacterium]